MTKFLFWAIAAAAIVVGACSATDGEREAAVPTAPSASGDTKTRYADANRDGKVTRGEAKADPYLEASFDRYDANDDEALDRAEFARLEAASTRHQDAAPVENRGEVRAEPGRALLRPRDEYPTPTD